MHILWTVTAKMAKISKTDSSPDKEAEDNQCSETTARIITSTKNKETFCKPFTLEDAKWLQRR